MSRGVIFQRSVERVGGDDRLDGWKAIAAYVDVSEPTARRYARQHRLPVQRMGHRVTASRAAIDAWRASLPGVASSAGGGVPAPPSYAPAPAAKARK